MKIVAMPPSIFVESSAIEFLLIVPVAHIGQKITRSDWRINPAVFCFSLSILPVLAERLFYALGACSFL